MKEAKEKWLKVIKEDYEELTPFTKCNFSGIYMIFIDNFKDEKIIPIYIGETKHFQQRYREHFAKLLKLNRMSYDEYCDYIRSKEAEHDYLYCKIFNLAILFISLIKLLNFSFSIKTSKKITSAIAEALDFSILNYIILYPLFTLYEINFNAF